MGEWEEFAKYFSYCQETGALIWIAKPPNTRSVVIGREAGTVVRKRNTRYRRVGFKKKLYQAHRIAWMLHYKEPAPEMIDHINWDGADNRICNLRSVNNSINQKNARMQPNNNSGITGVHFNNKQKVWYAHISSYGKRYYLYCGKDFLEACCLRKSAEKHFDYHKNHGKQAREALQESSDD